mmetsp:Transcript_42819/g.113386  ORF Transcript_42819/g.113386 Transcript_42819/m.113386 type:complete len:94 (+) Transcript_42819:373-654(+)
MTEGTWDQDLTMEAMEWEMVMPAALKGYAHLGLAKRDTAAPVVDTMGGWSDLDREAVKWETAALAVGTVAGRWEEGAKRETAALAVQTVAGAV